MKALLTQAARLHSEGLAHNLRCMAAQATGGHAAGGGRIIDRESGVTYQTRVDDNEGQSKEAEVISRTNQYEAQKQQASRMKEMRADDPSRQWREPDPYYRSGAVTGVTSEFQAEEDYQRKPQQGMRADDQSGPSAAGAVGVALPGSPAAGHPNTRPDTQAASGDLTDHHPGEQKTPTGHVLRPFPERVGQKVREFVKESVSTLTHGVNNAGQPGVAEKLKDS